MNGEAHTCEKYVQVCTRISLRWDGEGGAIRLRGAAVKEDVEIAPAVARIVLVDLPQLLGAHGCEQALRTHMCSAWCERRHMLCKRCDRAMVFAG